VSWLSLLLAIAFPGQDVLTIEDAVAIAVQNAHAVRIAESVAEQAKANQQAASGALRPQLNATGQYVRLAQGVSFSTGGSGFGGSTADSKQINVVLSQLIDISGVTRKTVEARKFQKLASESDVTTQIDSIKSQVRTQFYLVLQAQALVVVQEEELRNAQERLENAKRREAAGDVSHFDVLRFETDAKRSEQALVDSQGNLVLAKQALNNLLGRPIGTDFTPKDVTELRAVQLTPEQAESIAVENRPEVESGSYLVRAADSLADVESGGLKPSMSFSAQYNRAIDPGPGQTVQSLFGVLQVTLPVWDGGITRGRTRAAREVQEQAEIRLDQTKLAISLEVRSALTRIETTKKAFEVALSGQALAREALRLAQLRYDEGAGILLDVTTAQAEHTRAQGAVVTARYQYLSAVASLQRALGTDDIASTQQEGLSR
jgi:outer membrane protein